MVAMEAQIEKRKFDLAHGGESGMKRPAGPKLLHEMIRKGLMRLPVASKGA